MVYVLIRCVIMYLLVVLAVRLMGKRQIGELQPSELVITILISELASMPIQDRDIPLLWAVVPVLALAALEIFTSMIVLKSVRLRTVLYGNPLILMYKGDFRQREMKKARVTVDDILEIMRNNGIVDISQVEYVILETNGQLSVIEKDKQENQKNGQKKGQKNGGLPHLIIVDGRLMHNNIKECNVDIKWVDAKLKKENISCYKDVFLMTVDDNRKVFLVRKQ